MRIQRLTHYVCTVMCLAVGRGEERVLRFAVGRAKIYNGLKNSSTRNTLNRLFYDHFMIWRQINTVHES